MSTVDYRLDILNRKVIYQNRVEGKKCAEIRGIYCSTKARR